MSAEMVIIAECDFCGKKFELGFEDLIFESSPCEICGEHKKIYVDVICDVCKKLSTHYFRNDK